MSPLCPKARNPPHNPPKVPSTETDCDTFRADRGVLGFNLLGVHVIFWLRDNFGRLLHHGERVEDTITCGRRRHDVYAEWGIQRNYHHPYSVNHSSPATLAESFTSRKVGPLPQAQYIYYIQHTKLDCIVSFLSTSCLHYWLSILQVKEIFNCCNMCKPCHQPFYIASTAHAQKKVPNTQVFKVNTGKCLKLKVLITVIVTKMA